MQPKGGFHGTPETTLNSPLQRIQERINWTGSFSQKRLKWAWFYLKVGVASKISHTQQYYWNPLQEIWICHCLASDNSWYAKNDAPRTIQTISYNAHNHNNCEERESPYLLNNNSTLFQKWQCHLNHKTTHLHLWLYSSTIQLS